LTAKPTLEWAGSTVQVPVGMMVAVVVLMADSSFAEGLFFGPSL
jgi:hypothetical protein